MRNLFSVVGKILAAFFAVMFIATAVLVLVMFNLESKLFNAQTYKQALVNQDFYAKMPSFMGQMLASSTKLFDKCQSNLIACGAQERSPEAIACFENALGVEIYRELASNQRTPTGEEMQQAKSCLQQYGQEQAPAGGPPALLETFTAEDWEFIISSLLPPEDLKAMTDQALDDVFAFMNDEADSAKLSLVTLKQRLAGEAGVKLILQMLRAQPDCTTEQIIEMTLSILTKNELKLCNPPNEIAALVMPLIQSQLGSIVAIIPDEVTLIQAPASKENDPRVRLKTIRFLIHLSPLIPLGLLFLISILAVRYVKEWLNWWGIPLFIAGILTAITGLVGAPMIGWIVQNEMVKSMPAAMPAIILQSSNDLVRAVVSQLLENVTWQGLLLAILGLAMTLLGILIARRQALTVIDASQVGPAS